MRTQLRVKRSIRLWWILIICFLLSCSYLFLLFNPQLFFRNSSPKQTSFLTITKFPLLPPTESESLSTIVSTTPRTTLEIKSPTTSSVYYRTSQKIGRGKTKTKNTSSSILERQHISNLSRNTYQNHTRPQIVYPQLIVDNSNVPTYCEKAPYKLYPKNRTRESIVQLASFPGSGNTWMRHLLERGSGIATGNIYDADLSLARVFIGENVSEGNQVVAIKTHYPCLYCFSSNHMTFSPAYFVTGSIING